MSNAIDCSTMFDLPNPDEVEIVTRKGPFGRTVYEVRHGEKLVWSDTNRDRSSCMMQSYIDNGF